MTPHPPNESWATNCIVRWMVETPAGWVGAWDKDALYAYSDMARAKDPVRAFAQQVVNAENYHELTQLVDLLRSALSAKPERFYVLHDRIGECKYDEESKPSIAE